MIEDIRLVEKKDVQASRLSGGMKRKLRYNNYCTIFVDKIPWLYSLFYIILLLLINKLRKAFTCSNDFMHCI